MKVLWSQYCELQHSAHLSQQKIVSSASIQDVKSPALINASLVFHDLIKSKKQNKQKIT